MLRMCSNHTYLDACLGFIDLSLQGQLVLRGQLPLLSQLGLQMIQLLLQTRKLQTQDTHIYESYVIPAEEIPFVLAFLYEQVKG